MVASLLHAVYHQLNGQDQVDASEPTRESVEPYIAVKTLDARTTAGSDNPSILGTY